MNQRIGVNLDKIMDSYSRRIKIPAITQREKNIYRCNEDYEDCIDDDTIFLENFDEGENCLLDNIDVKKTALIGLGVLAGILGVCIMAKRRR